MVEFDRSAFISKFQEEATDILQRLNEGIINLEADPGNREIIDQALRDAHTLKGSSRMVGLMEISDIAHRMEDIMVKVREGEMSYTPEMSDSFFEALDSIVFLSDNAGKDVAGQIDIEGLIGRLTHVAEVGTAAPAKKAPSKKKPGGKAPAVKVTAPAEAEAPAADEALETDEDLDDDFEATEAEEHAEAEDATVRA